MNKKTFAGLLLIILFFVKNNVNAQLGQAQKITLDVDTTLFLSVKRSVAWDLVKDPAKWNKIYGTNISSFKTEGHLGDEYGVSPTLEMELIFNDGTKRKLKVEQYVLQYRFIAFKVVNSPAGITDNFVGITLDVETETSSKLAYRIKVDGSEPAKSELLVQLKREMTMFLEGINKNIVPVGK